MKKHIVFVVGKYIPENSANVNCIKNIVQILKKQDYKISIICGSYLKTDLCICDDVKIYKIKYVSYSSRLRFCNSKIGRIFLKYRHFFKSIFILPLYPNVTPFMSHIVYKKLIELNNDKKIDCVIGVFQPYFPIAAIVKFKKVFKDIPVIGYYLDVMKGANKPFGVPQKFFEKLCDITQKRDFLKLDRIFLPECSKVYYKNDYFSVCQEKIVYLNFPTLLRENYIGENASLTMNLIYAGTTNSIYRNPRRIIEIFIKLKNIYPNLVFHLYGLSDMIDQLVELEKKAEGAFVYHGVVDKKEADLALKNADYCVNFGNNIPGMVPSKIFELISSGKSIIHFTEGLNDSSLEYIEKYPKAYVINSQKLDCEIFIEMIDILKRKKINIDYNEIENLFYSATPKAVAEKIIEIIGK